MHLGAPQVQPNGNCEHNVGNLCQPFPPSQGHQGRTKKDVPATLDCAMTSSLTWSLNVTKLAVTLALLCVLSPPWPWPRPRPRPLAPLLFVLCAQFLICIMRVWLPGPSVSHSCEVKFLIGSLMSIPLTMCVLAPQPQPAPPRPPLPHHSSQ